MEGRFHKPHGENGNFISFQFSHEVATENYSGNHSWIEHPRGHEVDVAALVLPIREDGGCKFLCLNEIEYTKSWRPPPSSDAFVVGFPEGFSGDQNTPIWKRASIASEPDLGFDNREVILVDTIGNSGLSGSAVICKASGILRPEGQETLDSPWKVGAWKTFIGVYSGRLSDKGIGAQLARVWKAELIDELFARFQAPSLE